MDTKHIETISSLWIILLLATFNTISRSYVEGLHALDRSIFGPKPRGTIKTIEALEVGDIIDCVDIHKQPAFDNPLFKDLKMAPSSYPRAVKITSDPSPKLMQTWNKYGKCPKGTIPIRRTMKTNSTVHKKYMNDDLSNREYATVDQEFFRGGHGGSALFNLWKPFVESTNEFSLSQMWAVSGFGGQLNSVEAGWTVFPQLFHDSKARLFIHWTRDGYNRTGCYNQICQDFVQTDHDEEEQISLGAALEPTSVYDGHPASIVIGLSRSQHGDWWLQLQDRMFGFYPRQLFTSLGNGADNIAFGGEVVNSRRRQRHTRTAMGSGKFSREGFKKACFISHIKVANETSIWVEPHLQLQNVTKPNCYDLTFGPTGTRLGSHFYFGGPGGLSHSCE